MVNVVYEEKWRDGKRNGHGKLTHANGGFHEGEWKDNELLAEGATTLYPPEGKEAEEIPQVKFPS